MFTDALKRHVVGLLQASKNVVGIENCIFGNSVQMVFTEGCNVGCCPQ